MWTGASASFLLKFDRVESLSSEKGSSCFLSVGVIPTHDDIFVVFAYFFGGEEGGKRSKAGIAPSPCGFGTSITADSILIQYNRDYWHSFAGTGLVIAPRFFFFR